MSLMTGNKLFDTILTALLSVATLGTLGLFIFTEIIYERPLPNASEENEKMAEQMKKNTFSEAYKFKKMVINLPQTGSRLRFLEVEPHILTFKSQTLDKLDEFKPEIKDKIISITSKIEPKDLNTVTGKILLQSKMRDAINKILGHQGVKEVLFTKFVVQ